MDAPHTWYLRHPGRARWSLRLALVAAAVPCGCGSRTTLEEWAAADVPAVVGPSASPIQTVPTRSPPSPPPPPTVAPALPPEVRPCEAATIAIDQLRPTVTLLVDQSASMGERYPDRTSIATRWSLVHDALMNPESGVIKQLQLRVRFGIAFFTSHNGSSTGTCPIVSEVRAATNNYEAISALYNRMGPDDDTPTGDSIDLVVAGIEATGNRGPQSILLVTDGLPDTCAVPDPQLGQAEAIQAAQRAYDAAVDMYVLGISSDIAGANLQELANAGQGRPIASVWRQDSDAAEAFEASASVEGLTKQFIDIVERVPFCEVRLQRDVLAAEVRGARVELDGKRLPFSSADGFVLRDSRRLEIVGSACEAIKAGGKQLSVRISCD
jgi:hypothetical protein